MIANFLIPPEKLGTPKMSDSPWELLPTASNHAASLDGLYVFLTVVCGISFVLVIGAMVYFMWKYKKRSDQDKTSPLTKIGGSGVFTSALEEALRAGEIDAAVHSAKDLPSETPADLRLAAFLCREDPRDVLVSRHGRALAIATVSGDDHLTLAIVHAISYCVSREATEDHRVRSTDARAG